MSVPHLVICAEMPWTPSIGRNHMLARSAAAEGMAVSFVEAPLDVRALRAPGTARAWGRAARRRARTQREAITVLTPATLVPGHRSAMAMRANAIALRHTLAAVESQRDGVVVATVPWQWPALAGLPARRRVYDCGDDWRALIPGRAGLFASQHARIATEADAVVLVSDALLGEFPGARAEIVPNGADDALVAAAAAPPRERCLVYTGTLSERVDAPFLGQVLDRLPGWELELYGQCRYAGCGEEPAPELRALLETRPARWYGPVERDRLASVLDRGQVLVAAHRQAQVRGQSSMKLYDYVARGRPIVTTPGALGPSAATAPAGVLEAASAEDFAALVRRCAVQTRPGPAQAGWLAENAWSCRWARWRDFVLGGAR